MGDGVGLHTKVGEYAGYIATGVADAFGNNGFYERITLTEDKAIGVGACDYSVESEVAAQ